MVIRCSLLDHSRSHLENWLVRTSISARCRTKNIFFVTSGKITSICVQLPSIKDWIYNTFAPLEKYVINLISQYHLRTLLILKRPMNFIRRFTCVRTFVHECTLCLTLIVKRILRATVALRSMHVFSDFWAALKARYLQF